MSAGSQPTKNYYKEKFLGQFYARNYSKTHRKILKNLLKFGKKPHSLKDHEEMKAWRKDCKPKKDLHHNTFWHIIKKINEKHHWIHFLHVHMEIHLFFWGLFLFSMFCCGSQGLLSTWPGDNVLSRDVAPPVRLPPGHGDGQEEIRVFSQQGWDWKASGVRNAWPAPNSSSTSPTLWGLKWNLFTFPPLSRASRRHSFILHCFTYIKTRADKILLGPLVFFLFYDSVWISKHFRIRQG